MIPGTESYAGEDDNKHFLLYVRVAFIGYRYVQSVQYSSVRRVFYLLNG
jgi:hypothetical protein